jgi:hypothetical protein
MEIKFCRDMRDTCKHAKHHSWSNKECVRCVFESRKCSDAITEESNLFEQRIGLCDKCNIRFECWCE